MCVYPLVGASVSGRRCFVVSCLVAPRPLQSKALGLQVALGPGLAGELANAAWNGELSKVRSLLDRGAPPNTEAFNGFSNGHHSALNGAARNGHAAIVTLLLEQPVKLAPATHSIFTVLKAGETAYQT